MGAHKISLSDRIWRAVRRQVPQLVLLALGFNCILFMFLGTFLKHQDCHSYAERFLLDAESEFSKSYWIRPKPNILPDINPQQWVKIDDYKRQLPRYAWSNRTMREVPLRVVSLSKSVERRAFVSHGLHEQNVSFEFWEAVDGVNDMLYESEVSLYLDDVRGKYVRYRNDYELRKFGCDLSHIRLMHRMLSETGDFGLALEDDAALEPDFVNRLDFAMSQLPSDWDILYLRSCLEEPGEFVGQTVRSLHRAYCTLGYVYTRRFAHMVLMQMHGADNFIDVKINEMIIKGQIQAYIVDPPLASVLKIPSTMTYHHHDFRKFLTKMAMIKAEAMHNPIKVPQDLAMEGMRS